MRRGTLTRRLACALQADSHAGLVRAARPSSEASETEASWCGRSVADDSAAAERVNLKGTLGPHSLATKWRALPGPAPSVCGWPASPPEMCDTSRMENSHKSLASPGHRRHRRLREDFAGVLQPGSSRSRVQRCRLLRRPHVGGQNRHLWLASSARQRGRSPDRSASLVACIPRAVSSSTGLIA